MKTLRTAVIAAALCTLIASAYAVAQPAANASKAKKTAAGKVGPRGKTGPAGPIGKTGPAGPTGPIGPAGPKGDDGAAGAPGATGEAGAAGANGAKGETGAQGPAGPAGPKGDTGEQGPIGPSNGYTLTRAQTFELSTTPEFEWKEIAVLSSLPAGAYLINSTVTAAKRGASTLIRCMLSTPGHSSPGVAAHVGETGAAFLGSIGTQIAVSRVQSFNVSLLCRREYTQEADKATYVENVQIQAIKVGTLTSK